MASDPPSAGSAESASGDCPGGSRGCGAAAGQGREFSSADVSTHDRESDPATPGDSPTGERPTTGASSSAGDSAADGAAANRGGRPPSLNELRRQLITGLITAGMTRRQAARHVGISHTTIANEAERNPAFAHNLREAEMRREYEPLSSIMAARQRSWQAAAWILERTQPERYGKRVYTRPAPALIRQALIEYAEFVCRMLELDDDTRDQLEDLAEGLSRIHFDQTDHDHIPHSPDDLSD